MTKGKLYEEAKRVLPDWFQQTDDDNALTQAFDEAKKEFPNLPVIYGFSTKELVEIVDFWADINLWYIKWFGVRDE